jgi:sulfur carrier protein
MLIEINGEEKSFGAGSLSIAELLEASGVESVEMVSVQRNGEFVDKSEFGSVLVAEGDEIDFLYFMGGGGR